MDITGAYQPSVLFHFQVSVESYFLTSQNMVYPCDSLGPMEYKEKCHMPLLGWSIELWPIPLLCSLEASCWHSEIIRWWNLHQPGPQWSYGELRLLTLHCTWSSNKNETFVGWSNELWACLLVQHYWLIQSALVWMFVYHQNSHIEKYSLGVESITGRIFREVIKW